jgi:hypothetical protein
VVAYIAYVDDSGDETTSVYTALLIPIDRWSECLAGWLEFRRRLYGTYGIPADVELHAAEFVHGKGTPAPGVTYGVNTDRAKRRHVLKLASAQIGSMQALTLLARVMPGAKPADCYRRLIADLDDLMVAEGGWCLMVVDGDGTQQYHKPIHRELRLATRRIVEDPWHQESHLSQFVQMADIASYTVFQAHALRPSRRFMWEWMANYLHARESQGCCVCPP